MLSALFFAAAVGGSWISESNFQLYVPDGYTKREKRPLLVAIHGCTQTAGDFAGLARVARLADRERVLVLLPNQDPAANAMRCWNWFIPENQKRGAGEPAAIKAMIDWVEARYAVDRGRVYVFGISSGGYMTSILLSCYSDVFAAGMVASGGMYEAAIDLQTAVPTALKGSERDPAASGRDAYRCSGSNHRTVPVLVFHGSDDPFVALRNGRQTVDQFLVTNDLGDDGVENHSIVELSRHSDAVEGGHAFTWIDYGSGKTTLIRYYVVEGMGHAWSGGDAAFSWADAKGPDETAIMWDFVKQFRRRQ
jgi:poly(hydroxyalkanoate) depolymerase family esterase